MQRGERLRELRRQRGLPCDVVAHMAGCSTRTLIAYERWGIMPRRRETRERIARALGVDTDWLFPESEEVDS